MTGSEIASPCRVCGAAVPRGAVRCASCGTEAPVPPQTGAQTSGVTPEARTEAWRGPLDGQGTGPSPVRPALVPPLVREAALSATLDAGLAPIARAPVLLGERYEILSELGRGGMGVVYRARDLILEEEIALKVLLPQFTSNSADLDRFKGEIKTSRRITHPNVIRIHDFGVVGHDVFISMEMLTGGDLKSRLDRGEVDLAEAIRIGQGLCAGLQAAHDQGVIHRDIKPQNVLFDAQGTAKLSDFGIARLADTTSNTVGYLGTPFYMSPEQAKGARGDFRSDIYALGVVLYQMVTGKLPFYSDSLVGIAMLHAHEPPPPPRSLRPDLPVKLEALLLRALDKDPDRRYQRPSQILAELGGLGTVRGPAPALITEPGGHISTQMSGESVMATTGRRPRARAVGLLLALGLLVGVSAAVFWWRPWATTAPPSRVESEPGGRVEAVAPRVGISPSPPLPAAVTARPPGVTGTPSPPISKPPPPGAAPAASTANAAGLVAGAPGEKTPKASRTTSSRRPVKARRASSPRRQPKKAEVAAPPAEAPAAQPSPPEVEVTAPSAQPAPSEAPPAVAPAPDPKALAAAAIRDGDAAFADFRFREALRHYTRATAILPGDGVAREKQEKARRYGRYGDMVYVPAGEFVYGSNSGDRDERPRRRRSTRAFYIDRYEVSNRAYRAFVRRKKAPPPSTWAAKTDYPPGAAHLAVSGVAWKEARGYCRWRGKRLPTEVEWEKAARGVDGRRWPWGNVANAAMAVVRRRSKASVYGYKRGRSPYGAHHLAGNVWEWTATRDAESKYGKPVYIIRGGAYNAPLSWARTSNKARPTGLNRAMIGFRCAR